MFGNLASINIIISVLEVWQIHYPYSKQGDRLSSTNRLILTIFENWYPKIQQTKMLVTCQRFGDCFLFGLVWPYSSNQKNIMKVGSKSLLPSCSSNKL